ncbi:MAG: murein hydrolase activator EnvC family protein [Thermoleophilia bacterium]
MRAPGAPLRVTLPAVLVALALAALAVLGSAPVVSGADALWAPAVAEAKTKTQIDQELDKNQEGLARAREEIRKAEAARKGALDDIAVLDQRIDGLESDLAQVSAQRDRAANELDATREELSRLGGLLVDTRARLAHAERDLRTAEASLEQRAVNMYKSGGVTYLEVLLDTTRLTDLITRLDFLSFVVDQDARILRSVKELRAEVDTRRLDLESQEASAQEVEGRQAEQTARLESLVAERESKLSQVEKARGDKRAVVAKAESDKDAYEKQEAALEAESARLAGELRSLTQSSQPTVKGTGQFIRPVDGRISSPFGYRIHPIFKVKKMHTGVDMSASMGTPIRAADSGTVIQAGWRGGYGQAVVISHGDGLATLYAHQSKILVSVGDTVTRGDIIGKVGSTGYSTGPHLHFEVRVNGTPVDPMGYL